MSILDEVLAKIASEAPGLFTEGQIGAIINGLKLMQVKVNSENQTVDLFTDSQLKERLKSAYQIIRIEEKRYDILYRKMLHVGGCPLCGGELVNVDALSRLSGMRCDSCMKVYDPMPEDTRIHNLRREIATLQCTVKQLDAANRSLTERITTHVDS